ncbi:MAG TPA: DUF1990 domain-containing protein [Dongiaceae bacterium]|nr:DUF1990 domain-containing protein [Dongiaceae bacterium]
MLSLLKPSDERVLGWLKDRHGAEFSYPDVGATRGTPPAGWNVNRVRRRIGNGRGVHAALVQALFAWELVRAAGTQVFANADTISPGTEVALRSRHFGIWSVDFCRVVYLLHDEPEKDGPIRRTGFAYGTLPGHAVRGEEIFSVTWNAKTEDVWYEIFSFSLPANWMVRAGARLARREQLGFIGASMRAAAVIAEDAGR